MKTEIETKTPVTLDDFTRGYITCALWSSAVIMDNDAEGYDEPLDKNHGIDDIGPATLAEMVKDCAQFQSDNAEVLARAGYPANNFNNESHAGHDFWLSRNGHGAGYFDGDFGTDADCEHLQSAAEKFGEVDLYVHKGKIYA